MRTLGFGGEFDEVPWRDAEARLGQWYERSPQLRPMLDIVRSVLTSGADAQLAGLMSMTDLVVVPRLVPEPPYDEVIVRFQALSRSLSPATVAQYQLALPDTEGSRA